MVSPGCAQRHVVLERCPQFSRRSEHIVEPRRHHAHNRIKLVVERDLPAKHRGVSAEAPPPQAVADDRYVGAMELIVRRLEIAPQYWCHAQHTEKARAHALALEALGLIRTGQGWSPRLEHGHGSERVLPFRESLIYAERARATRSVAMQLQQRDDSIGVRVGQGLKQSGVYRTEDRRVRADPERKCEDGDNGEYRSLDQHSQGVFEVSNHKKAPNPKIAAWCLGFGISHYESIAKLNGPVPVA